MLVAAAVAIAALAFPAVSSAQSWVDYNGELLGQYSPTGQYIVGGPTGYDDHVTANVSGSFSFQQRAGIPSFGGLTTVIMSCEVTGAIELWNDGEEWAPGKNQVVSFDDTSCTGRINNCQGTVDMTSNNLPWAGDMSYYGAEGDFSGVDITLSFTGCGVSGWDFGTTGALAIVNALPFPGGCLDGFELDDGTMQTNQGWLEDISGSLEIQSVDGLTSPYAPADCVTEA